MFERLRQAGKRGQIKDSGEANFSVLNAPYRLLSGSEEDAIVLGVLGFACGEAEAVRASL
jgi:hypothetical protein